MRCETKCQILVRPACVCEQNLGHPWTVVSAAGVRAGTSPSVTEESGGVKHLANGVGRTYAPKYSYWEGLACVRWVRDSVLVAAAGHSLCTCCQFLLGRESSSYSVQVCMVCVCMCVSSTSKPQVGPATSAALLSHSRDIRQLEGPCWHVGRPVSVGCLWDKCVSATCWLLIIKPDQPVGRGTCEAGNGAQDPGRGTKQTEGLCQYSRELQISLCLWTQRVLCVCWH